MKWLALVVTCVLMSACTASVTFDFRAHESVAEEAEAEEAIIYPMGPTDLATYE